jgi:hypothetical protein
MVLKKEADRAAEKKLDVEQRDWTQVKRPALLWARAQDVLLLGYRHRAITEMFNLVKTYPQHPEAANWIGQIEALIVPPATAAPAPAVTPTPTAVPVPGAVPAQAPIGGAAVPAPVTIPAAVPGSRVLPR